MISVSRNLGRTLASTVVNGMLCSILFFAPAQAQDDHSAIAVAGSTMIAGTSTVAGPSNVAGVIVLSRGSELAAGTEVNAGSVINDRVVERSMGLEGSPE